MILLSSLYAVMSNVLGLKAYLVYDLCIIIKKQCAASAEL